MIQKAKMKAFGTLIHSSKEGQIIAYYYYPVGLESDVTSKRVAVKTCMISIRSHTILAWSLCLGNRWEIQ